MHLEMNPQAMGCVVLGWLQQTADAAQTRATVDAIDPPSGGAVLEVGCGPGHALALLAASRALGLVAGVDESELMVASARRRLDGGRGDAALDLRLGEAVQLPFPDERFDVVYAVNGWGRWPDPPGALAEMAGVLKPGGDLLLSIRDFRVEGRFEPPGLGAETARIAADHLRDLGLQVRTREIVHSPKRATLLVRGRKCGRADS